MASAILSDQLGRSLSSVFTDEDWDLVLLPDAEFLVSNAAFSSTVQAEKPTAATIAKIPKKRVRNEGRFIVEWSKWVSRKSSLLTISQRECTDFY
ncbi:MAG: hypothetical protein HRU46_19675 [Verrucomicrobiales bacterium]|nr:hypothetical protein [Verrucomicrobiales bacterium]